MTITKDEIETMIKESVTHSDLNNFKHIGLPDEPMWNSPIIGFAAGNDALFQFFKKDIGDFYWSPAEAFALKYKDAYVIDRDLTVISFGFAQTAETKKVQSRSEGLPSLKWVVTRGEWEPFIYDLCGRILNDLEKRGIRAVAIDLLPEWSRMTSEKYGMASKWSHRHTAFVAGLGTFGLSDGLITRQGKAMRFCTIIVEGQLPPDRRLYKKHTEWCKFYADGTCGDCINRCPVHAITKEGHDKDVCSAYLQTIKNETGPDILRNSNYIAGCGLCQTRIPCQDKVPVNIKELP
jgi:epoxyqueuosine reductase